MDTQVKDVVDDGERRVTGTFRLSLAEREALNRIARNAQRSVSGQIRAWIAEAEKPTNETEQL